MDLGTSFQLFSYVPALAFGVILWWERSLRHGARQRTAYLLWSLAALAVAGLVQTAEALFGSHSLVGWSREFVIVSLLYFLALVALEYAIHVKRIHEGYLAKDFRREVKRLAVWLAASTAAAVLVVFGPAEHVKLFVSVFCALLTGTALITSLRVFNLQAGAIRRRNYPIYAQIVVLWAGLALLLFGVSFAWFLVLNVVFIVRLTEEFFFWSQYQLRSDKAKLEQRQHTQNLLIRKVIAGSDDQDRAIVHELMQATLEKVRERTIVDEYRITGLVVRRRVGSLFRVDDPGHILGYCTPLTDSKTIKNQDKHMLTEQILRTTYDLAELRSTLPKNDFGTRLVQQALAERRTVVTSDLPEGLRGLQRLAAVVPVFDFDECVGLITVFKDSFDLLYPAEAEVLGELAENLATVWALVAGKEVQRERNRLQGEMNAARDVQTSILPKAPSLAGFDVATSMETATEVGGDVFDFVPTPYGTYFGIGDVAGHGLPAGMMAVISVAALHGALDASRVLGTPLPLDQVYDTVNRVLVTLNRDRIGSDKFMTQNYFLANGGRIDHVGTHLIASVWRARSASLERLDKLVDHTGFLGLSEYVVSKQSVGTFFLETGDVLVLYSDGVSEAKNASGALYGLEGIERILVAHATEPPARIVQAVLDDVRRHATAGDLKKYGGRFADDVSLVVLKKQ